MAFGGGWKSPHGSPNQRANDNPVLNRRATRTNGLCRTEAAAALRKPLFQMFESEIAVNENLLIQLDKIVTDILEESLFTPSAGHGHSPVWLLGHLAIVGEAGQRMLGGKITHTEWLRLFGPGSVDSIPFNAALTKPSLINAVTENYRQLRNLALVANEAEVSRPHGVSILTGTPIVTVKHCITHLLTSHFAFHLSQLSSCRRVAGFPALF